jgi:hypothetical protein
VPLDPDGCRPASFQPMSAARQVYASPDPSLHRCRGQIPRCSNVTSCISSAKEITPNRAVSGGSEARPPHEQVRTPTKLKRGCPSCEMRRGMHEVTLAPCFTRRETDEWCAW